jgi:hypothetical protein
MKSLQERYMLIKERKTGYEIARLSKRQVSIGYGLKTAQKPRLYHQDKGLDIRNTYVLTKERP